VIFFYITSRPDDKTIMTVITENSITIDGSDTTILNPENADDIYDHGTLQLREEEIERLEIIDSGYDFIGRKYIAIVEIDSYRGEYRLDARVVLILHYDKGWKLSENIGVLRAFFVIDEL